MYLAPTVHRDSLRWLPESYPPQLSRTSSRLAFVTFPRSQGGSGRLGSCSVEASDRGNPLSGREIDIVRLVADGLTNQEIADRMHITARTAQAHVGSAMSKLGARSRTQLAVLAMRQRIIPLNPDHD